MGRIKFSIHQIPDANDKEVELKRPYARIVSSGTKRMDEICEYITNCSSVTSADIKGVLEALSQYIGRELSYGYSVELEGIGHFSPSLKTTKQEPDEKGRIAYSVTTRGVNFRCANQLKKRVSQGKPQKVKRENVPEQDREGRKAKMLEYLQKHKSINITYYKALNNCTQYAAQNDIKQFVAEGLIASMGYKTHRMYMLMEQEKIKKKDD